MRIPVIDRLHRLTTRSSRRKRNRRQDSRNSFLSSLRIEPLEARRMLHGGVHDHTPDHALDAHIHADLQIVIEGQPVTIPADVGVDESGIIAFAHTHAADNELHLHGTDTLGNPTSYLTLGDFFDVWRTNAGTPGNNPDAVFSSTEILGNVADDDHTIRMFVNGVQVDSYENYQIHDGDDIVISYTSHPVVSLQTNQGTILMEMLGDDAPNTVVNFLDYVNDGDYDNSFIHRSIPGFVIQGGGFVTSSETFSSLSQFSSVSTDPAIVNEFGVSNTLGTVAMAKLGGDPNSATSQWFVNLADNSSNLDNQNGGFTVFARVLDMQPVEAIAAVPTTDADGISSSLYDTLPIDAENKLVVIESVGGDGIVSGVVFDDTDGDGVQDAGETVISGAVVFVDADANGTFGLGEDSITTGDDGSYQFRLPSGQHVIRQQVSIGKTLTTPADPSQATTVLVGGEITDLNFGSGVVPSNPAAVDLLAVTDTGSNDADNVTSKNNSSVVEALQFRVTGVDDGNLIKVFAGLSEIGQAVAVGGEAVVTTTGSQVLTDGSVSITATQSLGVLESNPSPALDVTVDTAVADFTSTAPTGAVIGETLAYDVENPEEADAGFSYSIDDLPDGMTINGTTGLISWTPVAAQLGTQQVTVTATDAAGNTGQHAMTVEVTGEVLVNFRLDAVDSLGNVLTEVTVGDNFTLQAYVQDLRETPQGVAAGYLDVVIANQLVSTTGSIVFGDLYQNAQSGDLSQPGLIDEVGGMSGLSVGDGDEELLFSVPMRADQTGTELFASNPADLLPQHDTLLYGSNDPVSTAKIAYQSKSLTINVGFTVENDLFNFDEDSQNVTLDVLLNDTPSSGGEALTISSVGTPDANGTVSIASDGKSLIYSPAADYFGVESITYTASDSTGSQSGTVVIQVHPQGDDPTATDDVVAVDANSENVFLDLLQNDSFAPDVGEQLEIIAVSGTTQNGLVTIGPNGTHVLYTPAANFSGVDTFSYTISDGTVSSGDEGQAVGNVTVEVGEIDDGTTPTANADAFTLAEDSSEQTLAVLANDTLGTGGGTLVISSVTSPSQGGVVQLATDSLSLLYTPAADFFGDESFTYTIGDGNGGVSVGQVTVTLTPENDPPQANADSLDAVQNIADQVLDPLSNDSIAPDTGESLTITAVGTPDQGGTVAIATDGLTLLYTPATDFDAQETFTYTISDGSAETSQATVTVNVLDYVPSSLAGSVYIDGDNDGVQDADEMVLAGVTVNLTGTDFSDQVVSRSLTTNSHGEYQFTDLAPGSYVISQVQPSYLVDGQETVGSQGGSGDQNDQITVELTEGTAGLDNDFGERGREASTFTLADFSVHTRETSMFGSFGAVPEEQWVALDSSWSQYQATDVVWHNTSHTLMIDVTDVQDVVNSAVLSWEAGHAVRQLGDDLPVPLITLDHGPAAVSFTAASDSDGDQSGDQSGDDGHDDHDHSHDEVVKVADFSLPDVNPTSATHGQDVSPRDYEGNVSAFYFGLASCTYCQSQFGHLDSLQADLDANHAELGVQIVGVNIANIAGDDPNNPTMTDGRDLPWLQDVDANADGDSDAWAAWEAQLRDVIILDASNQKISTYNLTLNDLAEADNYNHLKDLLVGAATAEGERDVYYQQTPELQQAMSLISRDQTSHAKDEYLQAVDQLFESWL